MVFGFVFKRIISKRYGVKVNREKEGAELLTSLVADIDLITDWVFFMEIRKKNGTDDEVDIGLQMFQFASCISGSFAWSAIASHGLVLDVMWRLFRNMAFFCVRPIALVLILVIPNVIMFPFQIFSHALFTVSSCLGSNTISRWSTYISDSILSWRKTMMQNFTKRLSGKLDPIQDRLENGVQISAGLILLLGVFFEDLPQVIVTFMIEDFDSRFDNISQTALLNLMLAAFDILFKLAEAWDSRRKNYHAGRGDYIKKIRHQECVNSVVIMDDDQIVSASRDGEYALVVWGSNGFPQRKFGGQLGSIAVAKLGRNEILSISLSNKARVFDTTTGDCKLTWNHPDVVYSVAVSDDYGMIATGCDDGTIRILKGHPYNKSGIINASNVRIVAVAFLDDTHLVSIAYNSKANVWNISGDNYIPPGEEGGVIRSFATHMELVNCVATINPECFVTGSDDDTIKLWNVVTGKCITTYRGHVGNVNAVLPVDEGRRFLSASSDKHIRMWEIGTGICEHVFRGNAMSVNGLHMIPGRMEFVSCSDDKSIRFWTLEGVFQRDDDAADLFQSNDDDAEVLDGELIESAALVTCV